MPVSVRPRTPIDAAAPEGAGGHAQATACRQCGGHRVALVDVAGEVRDVCPDCGAQRVVAPADAGETIIVVGRAGQKVIASGRTR